MKTTRAIFMCCIFTYVKFINTHLGHDPWECSHSSGALSGDRDTGGDGTQVPGGLHRGQRGGKYLVEGED